MTLRRSPIPTAYKHIVLVCGSRSFNDYALLTATLDALLQNLSDVQIIHGGAIGADTFARRYASERHIPSLEYRPDWKQGKQAGFDRNTTMVNLATHVVAFWDGESRGTLDTINKAKAKGLPLRVKRFERNPLYEKVSI